MQLAKRMRTNPRELATQFVERLTPQLAPGVGISLDALTRPLATLRPVPRTVREEAADASPLLGERVAPALAGA